MSYPDFSRQNASTYTGTALFSDPFADLASTAIPSSLPAMLRHAEFFGVAHELVREAYNRVAAYFLTDLLIEGDVDDKTKTQKKDYLVDRAGLVPFMLDAGLSTLVYGNTWASALMPFRRYLVCPRARCGASYPAERFMDDPRHKFNWANGFHGYCPACGYGGDFGRPEDEPDEGQSVILKLWNPHDMRVVYNEYHGQPCAYDWIIPADYRSELKVGRNKAVLATTPWEVIQAALNDENLQFNRDFVFHWRETNLPGLRTRGVGVPRSIVNYRMIYLNQILRRMTEVIAQGHVVPVRVISPANTDRGQGPQGDLFQTGYMGDLRSRVFEIIANHRRDPASIHFSPVALQMQSLGADARQLVPADLMKLVTETLLNGSGVPVEFFMGSIQTQNAPVGLRLIERIWAPFVAGYNRLLSFIGRRMEFLLRWQPASYKLESVRLVDAIELNQLKVQMAQAGLLSRTTATKTVDADFKKETRQKLDDQLTEAVEQARFQRQMDGLSLANQLGDQIPAGMLPGGGAPPGPGGAPPAQGGDPSQDAGGGAPAQSAGPTGTGGPPGPDQVMALVPQSGQSIDPQALMQQADQVAVMLIQTPESQRFGLMQQIAKSNELFHAMVKSRMEGKRTQAESAGRSQMMQQMFGASP